MKALRTAVSGSRNRFRNGSYDLDLTYITPRIIAMGYPASGVEKTYRNDLIEVAAFLNAQHCGRYYVFNLSERKYDYSRLGNRVEECGFPDHHPPPLQLACYIVNKMHTWILQSQQNVVAVHCMAGKGRTGVIISCYMIYIGHYGNIHELLTDEEVKTIAKTAVADFWKLRGQGVRFPSQARYIYYFIQVLRKIGKQVVHSSIPTLLDPPFLYLSHIILHGIPNFDAVPRGGCTPFLQVLTAPSQQSKGQLLYNSAWERSQFETFAPDVDGCIIFNIKRWIQADILVRCFHVQAGAILGKHATQMFHFTFHTDFIVGEDDENDIIRLYKEDIDDAHGNKRFPSTFYMELVFASKENVGQRNPSISLPGSRNNNRTNNRVIVRNRQADAHHRFSSRLEGSSTIPLSNSSIISHTTPVDSIYQSLRGNDITQTVTSSIPPPNTLQYQHSCSSIYNAMRHESRDVMGWLIKQGGFVKSWKKRWFVLRRGKLSYFATPAAPSPLGVVDLKRIRVDTCHNGEIATPNSKYCYFKVIPPLSFQRTYYLGAQSEEEMIVWINALNRECALLIEKNQNRPTENETFNESVSYRPPSELRKRDTSRRRSTGMVRVSETLPKCTFKPMTKIEQGDELEEEISFSSDKKVEEVLRQSSLHLSRGTPLETPDNLAEEVTKTTIQETSSCCYVYTTDELLAACSLQLEWKKSSQNSNPSDSPSDVSKNVTESKESSSSKAIEKILCLVLEKHPILLDAFEHDPQRFLDLIDGSKIVHPDSASTR